MGRALTHGVVLESLEFDDESICLACAGEAAVPSYRTRSLASDVRAIAALDGLLGARLVVDVQHDRVGARERVGRGGIGADDGSSLARFKEGFGKRRVALPSARCEVGPGWRRMATRAIEWVRRERATQSSSSDGE